MSNTSSSNIDSAARHQNILFAIYIGVLILAAVLTVLVYRAGNVYQGAVKKDAEARIEAAKTEASTESKRIEVDAKAQIAKVESDSRERIAAAKSEADIKIEETKARTAQLEKDAAELRKQNLATEEKLEGERKTRVELEKSLAPRELYMWKDGKEIASPLKPFAGVNVILEYLPDAEASRAASYIAGTVENAGWILVSVKPRPDINIGFFDGVVIDRPLSMWAGATSEQSELAGHIGSAVDALAELLTANGWQKVRKMPAKPSAETPDKEGYVPPGALRITVGFKPNPYFDPEVIKQLRKKEETKK